jgi:hypothetical protein
MQRFILFSIVATVLGLMNCTQARGSSKDSVPSKAQPALDQLKTLQGDWLWAEGEDKGKLVARYTVSSGGTTVVENLFPGTNHEMITVYHVDGDKLMLTHYCSAGNQPQMRAEPATDKLVFTCAGGSNMKSHDDGHMHAMTMTFIDHDHITCQWTWMERGQGGPKTFSFQRKK